jgi:CheY-like chemotaxis protein
MAVVLVVEDNPQNLKLTTVILQSHGHTVLPALDTSEAERVIATTHLDLILLDVALPGKDGYTFARELRARPETSKLPILAVSAFAMPGDAEKAFQAGFSSYLTKPIRRQPLLERVSALLQAGAPSENAESSSVDSPTGSAGENVK